MLADRQRGMTLVEIAVTMAILGILLAVALPNFSAWIQGLQIRTAAESIRNGLQLAQTEAIRRNATVRFNIGDATGKAAWSVGCTVATTDCPDPIQTRSSDEGSGNARVGISTATPPSPVPATQYGTALAAGAGLPAGVSFNSLGRVPIANIGTDLTRIDITNAVNGSARRLVVIVSSGGLIRLCDPVLPLASNPQGCS